MAVSAPYLLRVHLKEEHVASNDYPFNLPSFARSTSSSQRRSCSSSVKTGRVNRPSSRPSRRSADFPSQVEVEMNCPAITGRTASVRSPPPFDRRSGSGRRTRYFLRAEFQAHFASLLDERRADPDFWGDPVRTVRRPLAAYAVAWRGLPRDSAKPDSIRAPAVRRAELAFPTAPTGAARPDVDARGNRQSPVHHRHAFADSPDLPRRADPRLRRRRGPPGLTRRHVALPITKGILHNPGVYWRHLQNRPDGQDS